MDTEKKQLLHLADPMCSWCWGFAPVIDAIRERYADDFDITLILGGLRVGTEEILPEHFKQTVLHHWHEVAKATGQPFNFDFDLPESFRYDTEPSCRATVTVRELRPELTYDYFNRLHRAFYVENRDLTNTAILADLAEEFGIAYDIFLETFDAKETKQMTFDDFGRAYGFGVQGFPTIILEDHRGPKLLTVGHQPLKTLTPLIDTWLVESSETPAG